MIRATASFKDNLSLLPPIDGVARIELRDPDGALVAVIENQPGKKGSVAVYQYLRQTFGPLSAEAAAHALDVFAENTADARMRPGAHPNIDRLLEILDSGDELTIDVIAE